MLLHQVVGTAWNKNDPCSYPFFSFALVIVHFLCRVSRVLIHEMLVTRTLISALIETLSRRYYTAISVVLCLNVPLYFVRKFIGYSRVGKKAGYKIRYFTMTVQGSNHLPCDMSFFYIFCFIFVKIKYFEFL